MRVCLAVSAARQSTSKTQRGILARVVRTDTIITGIYLITETRGYGVALTHAVGPKYNSFEKR
jgi:hypothetical protein